MLWKSGFFVSRSATHIRVETGFVSLLAKPAFTRMYVAGRHSEMERSEIELRGRTGIVPRGTAGRHSEM